MSTDLEVETPLVFTGKVFVVAPAWTTTGEVTVATEVSELTSVTDAPEGLGAGPLRRIVPVEEVPPWTVRGERLTSRSCGLTVTVSTAVTVTPLGIPAIVAVIKTLR